MFINYSDICFDDESGEVYEDEYNRLENFEEYLRWLDFLEDREADMYEK